MTGQRARRVDLPKPDLLAITLRERVLVASVASGARGIGLVTERPKGEPASSFVRKLRKELVGSAIARVDVVPGTVTLRFSNGRALAIELDGAGNLVLLDENDRVIVALHASGLRARDIGPKDPYLAPPGGRWLPPETEVSLVRAGAAIVGCEADDLDAERGALDRAVRKAIARLDKRLRAIAEDAARAAEAPRLRADASAILAGLHAIPEGAREARVTDWAMDPPAERVIALDPALGAKGTADALFHRARRLERGVEKAEARRRETERERADLEALRARVAEASDREAIEALSMEARKLGVRGAEASARTSPTAKGGRLPFKRFLGHGDRPIFVGRGAADNDALTLRVAKPSDLWLHARGSAGAHVIVPLDKNEACPPELLVDAAHLAAHFSDARGEAIVDVSYAERRYVRKPRGFPPGAVAVDREKVIALRVEPERVARVLKTEMP